jgi:hypothetical protein
MKGNAVVVIGVGQAERRLEQWSYLFRALG